jgi:hypothetical protein
VANISFSWSPDDTRAELTPKRVRELASAVAEIVVVTTPISTGSRQPCSEPSNLGRHATSAENFLLQDEPNDYSGSF